MLECWKRWNPLFTFQAMKHLTGLELARRYEAAARAARKHGRRKVMATPVGFTVLGRTIGRCRTFLFDK